jgi:hypothetical protein
MGADAARIGLEGNLPQMADFKGPAAARRQYGWQISPSTLTETYRLSRVPLSSGKPDLRARNRKAHVWLDICLPERDQKLGTFLSAL